MKNIRVCFAYRPFDPPLDGTNVFTRLLRQYVSREPGFQVVDDVGGDYDVLFMNQLSRGEGNSYSLSDIREIKDTDPEIKIVIRPVSLGRARGSMEIAGDGNDESVAELLDMADFVIFQSAFQQSSFPQGDSRCDKQVIIHNGAAELFSQVPNGPKALGTNNDLILISSAMSKNPCKRLDIVASLSLLHGVKVIHAGFWPPHIDSGKAEIVGVQSHQSIAKDYNRAHYVLHPAMEDVCPNSLIEGLCAGLPAIYHPGAGSGNELAGAFGTGLDERDLPRTVARARENYQRMAFSLSTRREYYSIQRAASQYLQVFRSIADQ